MLMRGQERLNSFPELWLARTGAIKHRFAFGSVADLQRRVENLPMDGSHSFIFIWTMRRRLQISVISRGKTGQRCLVMQSYSQAFA